MEANCIPQGVRGVSGIFDVFSWWNLTVREWQSRFRSFETPGPVGTQNHLRSTNATLKCLGLTVRIHRKTTYYTPETALKRHLLLRAPRWQTIENRTNGTNLTWLNVWHQRRAYVNCKSTDYCCWEWLSETVWDWPSRFRPYSIVSDVDRKLMLMVWQYFLDVLRHVRGWLSQHHQNLSCLVYFKIHIACYDNLIYSLAL